METENVVAGKAGVYNYCSQPEKKYYFLTSQNINEELPA
jgi:hypothetical protein